MSGEAAPIIRLLARLAERYGPQAAEAMGGAEPEVAGAFRALTSEEVPIGTRAYAQNWLQTLLGASREPNPAASVLRAQGPTNVAPGAPAAQIAPSPEQPPAMSLMKKLQAYAPYGRDYAENVAGPQFGEESRLTSPPSPEPSSAAALTLAKAQRGVQNIAPGETAGAPLSAAEMLQRPAGQERQEMLGRLKDYLAAYKGGSEEAMPALKRLRPIFQAPPEVLPPEVKAGLQRIGGIPSEAEPSMPPDFPVTRYPYRKTPVTGVAGERDIMEGLRRGTLPPALQEFVSQLQESGQLPKDVSSPENMRNLLSKLYGSKPSALLGERKTIGEADPSRVGLLLQRFSELSPEEITRVLQSVKPSGIYRMGRFQSAAEAAAPQYQALGESRPVEEIVADLLRGGPSPTGRGEFAEKALYPIAKRRARLGLQSGEPLTLENVLGALKGSEFIPSKLGRPIPAAKQQLLAKVLQMMKQRGAL